MGDEKAAEWVDIGDIHAWEDNPRDNAGAVDAVAASIRRFGFASPIIARKADGEIIAGHTRYLAAQKLGLRKVPVRYMDLDPVEAHLLALADNRVGEIAEWDADGLADVIRGLTEGGADFDGVGFSAEELDALLAPPLPEEPEPDDVVEPAAEGAPPDSAPGEVYELGPHRLVCGDSTSAEAWAALLPDGERLQAVWTDPPYGVAYVGKTADALEIQNDKLDNDGLEALLRDSLGMALAHCEPGAAWYVAAPAGPRGNAFAVTLLAMGVFRQRLVWVKSSMVLGHSDYHYKHEDIYYGFAPGASGRRGRGGVGWFGDNAQTTVLEFDKPSRNGDHPTMKPVELVRHCLRNSAKPGWVVGEPFGGSGTTLIAAAMEGMVARVIELDPRYCDVIRRRWTAFAAANNLDPGAGALEPVA